MEVDNSSTCDETIPKCKELAKSETRFNEALEMLLQLEKQARIVSIVGWILCQGSDMMTIARVLVAIVVRIC
jgi:26S proteasome regulatory subunit N5